MKLNKFNKIFNETKIKTDSINANRRFIYILIRKIEKLFLIIWNVSLCRHGGIICLSVTDALCKARTCDYTYRNLLRVEICRARSNIRDLNTLKKNKSVTRVQLKIPRRRNRAYSDVILIKILYIWKIQSSDYNGNKNDYSQSLHLEYI